MLRDLWYHARGYQNISYMISRHSYDDKENAKIFGIPTSDFAHIDVFGFNYDITLACTCFKGGMNSVKKIIEYIKFADENYVSNILFTNLQEDASVSLKNKNDTSENIDPNLFNEAINLLMDNGWIKEKYPIVSNSGYELITIKSPKYCYTNDLTIRFKRYVSKKELDVLWLKAVKRTFDLSISPNGTLYDDWSEKNAKSLNKKI